MFQLMGTLSLRLIPGFVPGCHWGRKCPRRPIVESKQILKLYYAVLAVSVAVMHVSVSVIVSM